MADERLLEEKYGPDQYCVLVTCIFLNRTRGPQVEPFLRSFLERYPTPESVKSETPAIIAEMYFAGKGKLGLPIRAQRIVTMAKQLLDDPPKPNVLRTKSTKPQYTPAYASEVGHLSGIGEYGSDAWRLFCKENFYLSYGVVVRDEWKKVHTKDKWLQKYIARRERDEREQQAREALTALAEDLPARMSAMNLAATSLQPRAAIVIEADKGFSSTQLDPAGSMDGLDVSKSKTKRVFRVGRVKVTWE